ncbi:hypothetical protein F5B22DRAFT_404292 [Xylaria bambusicola]|uniref:uncharacterized protein n=1 Tax=Xylaria bambusicola TaxID=326684 RepID=UPI002008B991|nr:uncharacterized protein F5B22DRAFT_404292 [Xylaria bambusicola]KAI0508398.1 hypothetical protein F5B22DRAFT_404292 [Xylaria bambusicola]
MLVSIGRSATRRLVSAALTTSSTNLVILQAAARVRLNVPGIQRRLPQTLRGFATGGRPKKGSPSRAVKTPTKKPAKKSTATAKPKAKRKPVKKTKPKSAAKPKPKPKKPKISAERKAINDRRDLRETALFAEPKNLPVGPWQTFISERIQGSKGSNTSEKFSEFSQEFKALSSDELQRLKSKSELAKTQNEVSYKAWVESHTPQEIFDANLARRALKRKYNIPKGSVKLISDERWPKRPISAFTLFTKARWASGEFAGIGRASGASARIGQEWKKLTPAERKVYEDSAKMQQETYQKAVDAVRSDK